ncbi:MAG: Crp/Fnr family transcriptional regulator [Calditrichia bacterium]
MGRTPKPDQIRSFLANTPLFRGLQESSLEKLADICIPKTLKRKEILFFEGEPGRAIYICLSGAIQLLKGNPDGKEIIIKIISSGELFGEVILFEKNTYPVTAMALKESQLLMVSRHQFNCLLEWEDFRTDFIRALMQKQRYLTEQIRYLSCSSIRDRLKLFLANQYGRRNEIYIPFSKKDVAQAIGVTPETLSRLLASLKEEKTLIWEGKIIRTQPAFWKEG